MIRFGLRLTLNGGKDAAIRLALTATAVTLGVGMLLAALAATNAVNAQNGRYAWLMSGLEPAASVPSPSGSASAVDPVWWLARADFFDGDRIIRVDVAATGPASPVPPGISELPGAGEFYASPAMNRLLESTQAAELGDRFGGTFVGTIGDEALPAPDSLIIVVGRIPAELAESPDAVQATSIATTLPDDCGRCYAAGVITTDGIAVIFAVTAVALLFPVVIFIGTATRLSAARREQRFAAMRLVGATPRQISTIATVESTVAAVVGVVAGFALFFAIRPLLAQIPFTGDHIFLGDLSLGPRAVVLVALGVPAAAAIAALMALRRVQVSPLGVSRRTTPRAPRAWRLIPLLVGLAELGLWTVVERPSGTSTQILSYMSGIVMTMIGLLVAGPWLTMVGSRLMARRACRPASLIAGRRLSDDPKAGFRSISGLVLALFITTVAVGVIATLVGNRGGAGSASAGSSLTQRFMAAEPENLPVVADDLVSELQAIPGVEGVAVVRVDPTTAQDQDPGRRRLLLSCSDLADVPMLGHCPAGAAVASYTPYYGSEASDLDARADTTWPAATVAPADLGDLPAEMIYVTTDGSTDAVELARTTLHLAFPDHVFPPSTLAEDEAAENRQLEQWKQLANVVIFTTLPIAGCSLAVSVATGLNDRKRPFSLLRLAGTPLQSLQRVVALESALPLVIGAAVSIGAGFLTAHLFLRAQLDYSLQPPGVQYIVLTLAGLAASFGVIASTLPLLRRITGPETARSE